MSDQPSLRPSAELEADRADCLAYQPASKTDREQGAIDAYDWLLGRRSAPLSGLAAATPANAAAEARRADDSARGRAGAPPVTGPDARWTESYVLGVRDALLWALRARRSAPGGREDFSTGADAGGLVVVRRREPRYRRTWDE